MGREQSLQRKRPDNGKREKTEREKRACSESEEQYKEREYEDRNGLAAGVKEKETER